jgi:hypothetical protein
MFPLGSDGIAAPWEPRVSRVVGRVLTRGVPLAGRRAGRLGPGKKVRAQRGRGSPDGHGPVREGRRECRAGGGFNNRPLVGSAYPVRSGVPPRPARLNNAGRLRARCGGRSGSASAAAGVRGPAAPRAPSGRSACRMMTCCSATACGCLRWRRRSGCVQAPPSDRFLGRRRVLRRRPKSGGSAEPPYRPECRENSGLVRPRRVRVVK